MTLTIDRDMSLVARVVASPLGALTLIASADALVGVYFEDHRPAPRVRAARTGPSAALDVAEAQLASYFAHASHRPQLPLAPRGSALELAVWSELARIPSGETRTYGAIARALGRPTAARAIGSAVARNPLSIVVPCHRVIGADGSLTGFAGGVERKAWLLAHEGVAQRGVPGGIVASPY